MKLYAYESRKSLTLAGCFTTQVNVCRSDKSMQDVTFYVIEENGQPHLGKDTATKLGILHIGTSGNSEAGYRHKDPIKRKYPECFDGLGKLKDFQLKIAIDENVKPVVQPLLWILYHLRDNVEEKLQKLESYDIIENVNKPSNWMS
jgi:hypothetical protein